MCWQVGACEGDGTGGTEIAAADCFSPPQQQRLPEGWPCDHVWLGVDYSPHTVLHCVYVDIDAVKCFYAVPPASCESGRWLENVPLQKVMVGTSRYTGGLCVCTTGPLQPC